MIVIRDRVKKKIAKVLERHGVFDLEEDILSIKELAIVDREAGLPNPKMLGFYLNPEEPMVSQAGIALEQNLSATYSQAQQDMRKAHFVKEVIDEKTDRAE